MTSLLLAAVFFASISLASPISYWDVPRRGTNFFNERETAERFTAARAAGIEVVRLAPNKWLNGRPQKELGDFLIGPKAGYSGLVASDVALLKKTLDSAHAAKIKVVLTMLSVPGARWSQHNDDVDEQALWQSDAWQNQTIRFWRDLAAELKGHPALIGYNLRNEPSPELIAPRFKDWYLGDYGGWAAKVKNTPRDLNRFYRKAVAAIREVDREMPIVLDGGFYATPWSFKILEPIPGDDKILYSFHMYEPFAVTSHKNGGKYSYPGKAPAGESDHAPIVDWNRKAIRDFLAPVSDWQKRHGISSNRVFAAEIGIYRRNAGASEYLDDVLTAVVDHKWHWAFYSFREDQWEGMDYELGADAAPPAYWEAIKAGKMPGPDVYKPNALWNVIRRHLLAPE